MNNHQPASLKRMLWTAGVFSLIFTLLSCQPAPVSAPAPTSVPAPTSTAASTAGGPFTFRNPLNSSGPDPWMTYYQGNYYLAATTWGGPDVGLTMRKGATIEALKNAPAQVIWQDGTTSRCCNYWAPEFFLLNGPNGPHWYGYFTGGPARLPEGQRMHVIESAGKDPMGPYTYKAQLKDSTDGWAIDTSVLQLEGRLYLLFSAFEGPDISAITNNQNIYIAPLSDPWTISGERVLLSVPTKSWERQDGNVNEGPVVLQHDGKTFIVYSASGCWGPNYKLGMLTYRGSDPLQTGSWEKFANPVFQSGNRVFSPGHNSFMKSPDGSED